MKAIFDLEKAIATWRSAAARKRIFTGDDLDELEAHVRDLVDHLVKGRCTEEEAYRAAIRRLGDPFHVEDEYRKVYWAKIRHRRRFRNELLWSIEMMKNYWKIAIRNLLRQPGYAGINVLGLSVGMACCLMILTFIRHEWSYDRFHEDVESIFRVNIGAVTPDGDLEIKAGQPIPLASELASSFDEIVAASLVIQDEGALIESGSDTGTEVFEETVLFTRSSFFDVFSVPLLHGNPTTVLDAPESVVLSETAARKFFGDVDVIDRRLKISFGGSYQEFVVTGVAKDLPGNSSIRFNLLLPVSRWPDYGSMVDSWTSWVTNTYVRLDHADNLETLQTRLPAFTLEHYAPMIYTWQMLQWLSKEEGSFELQLQPLTDVHFAPDVLQAHTTAMDAKYPYFMLALAIAVLLIACINFTTLAIGRAARRAREVGMRKAVGAARAQLMQQFWGEALLMSGIAVVLSIAIVHLLLPLFARIAETELALRYDSIEVGALLGLGLITGLIAGAYPAAYQSRFTPITILRGIHGAGGRNRWMSILVVVQFTLSISFVTALIVFSAQIRFLQTRDLGFDEERVVVVQTNISETESSEQLAERLKTEWTALPGVIDVAASSTGFSRSLSWNSFGKADGEAHLVYTTRIDRDFVRTLDLNIAKGRSFDSEYPGAGEGVILVNEALVKEFELDEPLGQTVGGFGEIAGVVKDYHFKSLHNDVEPMVLFLSARGDYAYRYLYVRLRSGDVGETMSSLQAAWENIQPDRPFSWYFLEEELDRQYMAEKRSQQLIRAATVFAVIIACLGLFGLAAYAAERRTKEIAIRKAIGASIPSVVAMLSKEFIRLVVLAAALSAPFSWIVMQRWLQRFAFRIDMTPWMPALAAAIALLIALLTVSYQAVRAARTNPIESLRYE